MAVPVIPRLVKVATPETVFAVAVPTSVPPEEMVAVMVVPVVVTVLLPESCKVTCGWVVNAAPDAVPTDDLDRFNLVAAPAAIAIVWVSAVRDVEPVVTV